jgi:hypothetical protein
VSYLGIVHSNREMNCHMSALYIWDIARLCGSTASSFEQRVRMYVKAKYVIASQFSGHYTLHNYSMMVLASALLYDVLLPESSEVT